MHASLFGKGNTLRTTACVKADSQAHSIPTSRSRCVYRERRNHSRCAMSASSEPVRVAVSPQRVKPLPETFTRNRYQFEQLYRTDSTAIYIQHINGRQKAFEVVVITVADRKVVKVNGHVTWDPCPPYECYPSSEAWGTLGWTYTTEADARAKYDLLNATAFKIPASPPYSIRARLGFAQDALETTASINTAGDER